MQCRAEGRALLVHPKGEPDPHAAAFAAGLAADPQHTLAVVDLPHGSLEGSADAVARLLAGRGESLRLVFGRGTPQESRRAAQRIADRLGRLVLAPDGAVLPTDGGGLFIPSEHGAGWLRFRPGRAAERDSRRFPKPRWEFSTFDRPWTTSGNGIAEPAPCGVWVRSPHDHPAAGSGRRLVDRLPSHPDILTVILGSPGGTPVTLADVTRLWETVLPSARSWVRFLHLGPVVLPEGAEALGQELADALGQQVVLYAGVPVESRDGLASPEVAAVRPDGTLGHRPFVSELMYFPRTGGVPAPPALFGLRRPLFGVPEITTGVYEYAADAVLEVVQSGLWMRPPAEPADGDAVRRVPAAPGRAAILYDRGTPEAAERMRSLAEDMLWRLDPECREGFTVAPADEPGRVAVPADDAHLWSSQDATATGPRAIATGAFRGRTRNAEVAPWGSRSPAATAAAGHAFVRAEGPDTASALARLDVDGTTVRVRGSAAAVPHRPHRAAPPAARTGAAAPRAGLPRVESGDDVPVTGGPSAAGRPERETDATASAATATGGAPLPEPGPRAPRPGAEPREAPRTGPDPMSGAPAADGPAATAAGQGPVPATPGPVEPVPASPRPAGPARLPLPDLPAVSEPGHPGEPPKENPRPADEPGGRGSDRPARTGVPMRRPAPGAEQRPAPEPRPQPVSPVPRTPGSYGTGAAVPPAPAAEKPELPPQPAVAPAAPDRASRPVAAKPAARPAPSIRLESDSPAAAPVAPADPGRADGPAPSAPAPAAPGGPGPRTTAPAAVPGVRVQPAPKASACAVPPERGTEKERDWVRRTLSTQYNAVAGTVSRVMSESPGLRGGARGEAADALTDLVAVRLFLSGDGARVNAAVRAAAVGPHVPLARCVAAGLRRLPSYRGAALLRARASAAERAWFREGRLVTEWAFCTAYGAPRPGPHGATDFLIWSITARRTNLIDPAEPDRVVFLPGTTFKVLRPAEGEGPVLLRELSPSEIASDGKVDVQRVPLDEIALDGLDRAAAALRADDAAGRDERGDNDGLGTPPGLIGGAPVTRQRPRGSGGGEGDSGDLSAPDEGANL
ncbi:hypothetical protein VT52_017895 [Streptomyces malaysiense]|uniref:NAD(+)--protein-arginine ADP-ribosyltransferase n=1 Tax=Streptomyces malaysiense TaxID=1428626 RepID=A0A1J4PZG3_9ACTN|nr:hypothetical protein VT52_017895 [Streptomyces malaysiense]